MQICTGSEGRAQPVERQGTKLKIFENRTGRAASAAWQGRVHGHSQRTAELHLLLHLLRDREGCMVTVRELRSCTCCVTGKRCTVFACWLFRSTCITSGVGANLERLCSLEDGVIHPLLDCAFPGCTESSI